MKIPKELIKEYVKSENFTNTTDIMESIKSMFADVLNEVLQCEMDEQLGYDKHARTESGEEKKNLTVEALLGAFAKAAGTEFANDRALLG